MAEHDDSLERSEEPSAKRRREAKDKGQVPRSRELGTLLIVVGGAVGLLLLGDAMGARLLNFMRSSLSFDRTALENTQAMPLQLAQALGTGLAIVTPMFSLLVIAALVGALALGGWAFGASGFGFKSERINPGKGLARMVSAQALIELAKGLAKFLLIGGVAVLVLYRLFDQIIALGSENLESGIRHLASLCGWSFLGFGSALALIAAIDVPFQLRSHLRKLRMTKQEVREEAKATEGRPEVKQRLRALQREMARRRMMDRVPEASVIVTNPTHYAVALKYEDGKSGAPIVVAKGRELVAARIRAIAEANGVPVFSAPPLARALYATTDLDCEVPAALYRAVAQVLAYVYQLKRASGLGEPQPEPPINLPVPAELVRKAP